MADDKVYGLAGLRVGQIYPELGQNPLTPAEVESFKNLGNVSKGELEFIKNQRASQGMPSAIPTTVNTNDLNKIVDAIRYSTSKTNPMYGVTGMSQVPSVLAQQGNVVAAANQIPGGAPYGTFPQEKQALAQDASRTQAANQPNQSSGLDIDSLLKEYLTGMTTGAGEAKTAAEKAVEAQYGQAAGRVGASVAQGRRTLDSGGYQAALMKAQGDLETQRISQLADIASTYNQLMQKGYGEAAGIATTLRGQNISKEEAQRRLDLTGQQISQEYELNKAAQALQTKQFEESLKQFEKTYGLQLQSSPYNMAKLSRQYELQDRPYLEDLAKRTAANYAPSFQEQLMGLISGGANIYANLSNPYAALLKGGK